MLEGKYDEVEDFGLIFHCCYLAVFISVTEKKQRRHNSRGVGFSHGL
jgi:hypothetical protein